MKKHILLLFLTLSSLLHAKELKNGVHTTLSKSHELRMITVVDKKVRSVDVFIRNSDKFSRGCWSDYGDFQLIVLTSMSGSEVYSFKCVNGKYEALSKDAEMHVQVARGFCLSAIVYKNELIKKPN